ncbi:MAG: outer membrane protein assembly factor BamC [Methylococcales bacterium]
MKRITITFYCLLILNVSGCGSIKALFPDKEKDYQFTTEIPELQVPSDLTDTIDHNTGIAYTALPIISKPLAKVENKETTENDKKPGTLVELVEYSGGATRIRIEDTIERSWRIVGKALSGNAIEITNRDENDKLYTVQYDPDFKKVEDGSLWDEVLFIFGSDPANDKEFKIRLAENGALTEVIVLDKDDLPLSQGAGLKLLNLLYKTIKDDLNTAE